VSFHLPESKTGKPDSASGFTLIELMITVSIVGIMLGIAIPGFSSTITSNRLATTANQFLGVLNFARSEAVSREERITVRRIGTTVASWDEGWDVFVDKNGNGTLDDTNATPCETNADGSLKEDCLLKKFTTLPKGYTLRVGATTVFKDAITFQPSSLPTVTATAADAFTLCSKGGDAQRTIAISATGRPKVSETAGACT
jgi:type IV fimbrial biogenesis protein FimT